MTLLPVACRGVELRKYTAAVLLAGIPLLLAF